MEIKVLNKTFDLLELIRERFPEPVLPGEAAAGLGIPRSTCVRLMKLLTGKGYLEQLSPRKGYSPIPIIAVTIMITPMQATTLILCLRSVVMVIIALLVIRVVKRRWLSRHCMMARL